MDNTRGRRAVNGSWVVPSLLDRLIGDRFAGEGQGLGARVTDLVDAHAYRRTVLSDLEFLLNTVCAPLPDGAEDLVELPTSIAAFGIPDLSALSVNDPDHWRAIEEFLLRAIKHHEPRLSAVSIEKRSTDELTRSIGLLVTAQLTIPPLDEPIVIDARLNLENLRCELKERA